MVMEHAMVVVSPLRRNVKFPLNRAEIWDYKNNQLWEVVNLGGFTVPIGV